MTSAPAKAREAGLDVPLWIGISVLTGLVVLLYAETLTDLAVEWWTSPESSYGLLIPPFSIYLIWMRRHELASTPTRRDLRGVAGVATACLIFLTGKLAAEFFLSRTSFVILLAALIWTFWGLPRLRMVGFDLCLLATMVPPPAILYNAAAAPLQLFASQVATRLAQILGVSVYRDGNVIHLADISLGVAEACSGLHSLSALAVASLVLGLTVNAAAAGRILLFVLSVPLAILVNVFRVTGTAILADSHPELAIGYYHSFSGWLVFVLGFGLLWLVSKPVFRVLR